MGSGSRLGLDFLEGFYMPQDPEDFGFLEGFSPQDPEDFGGLGILKGCWHPKIRFLGRGTDRVWSRV